MSNVTKPIILNETGEQIVQKLSEIASSNKSFELLLDTKADKTSVSAPYNFKGNTTYDALPTSNNKVNDTYYCTDVKCKYTWNGSGWFQSSMNESDYTDELSQLSNEIDETLTKNKETNNLIMNLTSEISSLNRLTEKEIIENTFVSNDGELTESNEYYTTLVYEINPCNLYHLICYYGYSVCKYAFYDASGNVLHVESVNDLHSNNFFDGYVVSPLNATTLKITKFKSSTNYLYGVEKLVINEPKEFIEQELEWQVGGYYSILGRYSENEDYKCVKIPVNSGEKFFIYGFAYYQMPLYCLLKNDEFISTTPNVDVDTGKIVAEIVEIPNDVNYLVVNSTNNVRLWGTKDTINAKVFKLVNDYEFLPTLHQKVKWCAIGDSLTSQSTLTENYYNYVDYIAKTENIEAVNLGVGGTGYVNKGGRTTFEERIQQVPTDSDIVTVFGSFNDVYRTFTVGTHTDTDASVSLYGVFNSFFDKLYERVPNASVGVILPTPWSDINNYKPTDQHYADAIIYMNTLKDVCERRSIPYLDLFVKSGLRPWEIDFKANYYLNGDGTHPNSTAWNKFLTPKIKVFIKELIEII